MNVIMIEQRISRAKKQRADALRQVLGKRVSQNQSPTGTAMLIEVNPTYCVFESLQSEYRNYPEELIGFQYSVPTGFAWNAYFF
jgi:hypothetical protein